MNIDEAKRELCFCDSYSRLPALVHLLPQMERSDWLRVLGEFWTICDNIGREAKFLASLLEGLAPSGGAKTITEMMTKRELSAFQGLPDAVTIYRGCYQRNKHGLSWSLSEDVATRFPTRYIRYLQKGTPLLLVAEVKKEDVIALKLSRKEREVITWKPKITAIRELVVAPEFSNLFEGY